MRLDVIKRTFITLFLKVDCTVSKTFYTKLENRGLIQIEGEDRRAFLQGLITNDIALLDEQPSIYACLLSPQGKFLHDFFVSRSDGVYFIECEGGERAQDLYERLKKYRLRSNVQISIEDDFSVYATIGTTAATGYPDPRHESMGWRAFEKQQDIPEQPFETWDAHRIMLCIPDGSRDMVVEFSTMLECRIDKLHGVSFGKGCYVGQELTARMHHRGLGKKHLYALRFEDSPPAPRDEITADGHLIGEMRSSCGNLGIAQIKDDATDKLAALGIHLLT